MCYSVSRIPTSEFQKNIYPFSVVQFITPQPLWKWFSSKTTAQINAYHSHDTLSLFRHERKTSILMSFLLIFQTREAQGSHELSSQFPNQRSSRLFFYKTQCNTMLFIISFQEAAIILLNKRMWKINFTDYFKITSITSPLKHLCSQFS